MGSIRSVQGKTPRLGEDVFVAENATVIGDVVLGDRASIWFGSVLRGDVESIRIGSESNLQDLCVVHVHSGGIGTRVGEKVTVGHRAVLHACTVGDLCLVGIGAILMDGVVIENESIIGAGSLVAPGTRVPPRVLALGSPARVKRALTEGELAFLRESAAQYVRCAAMFREGR